MRRFGKCYLKTAIDALEVCDVAQSKSRECMHTFTPLQLSLPQCCQVIWGPSNMTLFFGLQFLACCICSMSESSDQCNKLIYCLGEGAYRAKIKWIRKVHWVVITDILLKRRNQWQKHVPHWSMHDDYRTVPNTNV